MQRLAAETNPQDHEKFADIAALSLGIDKLPLRNPTGTWGLAPFESGV
jgi:hypothetical protein